MPCPGCNCFGILFVEECFLSADSPVVPSPSPPHACAALLVPMFARDAACPGYCSSAPFRGRKRSVQQSIATAASHYVCGCPSSLSFYREHRAHSILTHGVFLLTCELPGGVFPPSYEPRHGGSALLVTFYCFVIHFPEEVLLPSGTGGFALPFTG